MESFIGQVRQMIRTAQQSQHNLMPGGSLMTSMVRQIAQDNFRQISMLSKDEKFSICEELFESGDWRDRTIAFQWVFGIRRQYTANDFTRFESWLGKYVDGWGSCDDFCTHAFGHLIYAFPEHIASFRTWTFTENRWFRRGAAVVLIQGIRRQRGIDPAFKIADQLLMDSDDLVQRGYGWMLKEVSNYEPQRVFEFVMQRKAVMPRTALRYAIEKLSPELHQRAMEK